jgi:hypothetical protein
MSKLKNFQKTQVRHWFDFPSEHTNTTINFYGGDNEELFDKNNALDWNVNGGEQVTSHIKQTNKYTKDSIKYTFNSVGMRGPEMRDFTSINRCPTNRILHIGASFAFGFGVNEHETYPHYLNKIVNGCYWNVSPANTIFQVVDILEDLIEQVSPTAITITTPRFIQDFDFLTKTFRDTINDSELSRMFLETKMTSKKSIQNWLVKYLNLLSIRHNIKIIFVNHGYKYWKDFKRPIIENQNLIFKDLSYADQFVDLSRDCRHPGPKSHEMFAEYLFKLL